MKFVTMLFVAFLTLFCSPVAFADVQPSQEQIKQVNDSITAKLAVMSDSQKKELLENLNGTGGNQTLQSIANIGEQIGKGLGSAAKELGIAANEFANSKVGTIAIVIILWHFIGKSILWFLFISVLLYSITKFWKRITAVVDKDGKVVAYSFDKFNDLGDGIQVCTWLTTVGILVACVVGAATQF